MGGWLLRYRHLPMCHRDVQAKEGAFDVTAKGKLRTETSFAGYLDLNVCNPILVGNLRVGAGGEV